MIQGQHLNRIPGEQAPHPRGGGGTGAAPCAITGGMAGQVTASEYRPFTQALLQLIDRGAGGAHPYAKAGGYTDKGLKSRQRPYTQV